MSESCCKRGFVTIATGAEQYYQMAFELLRSYREQCVDDTPFAIICDRETPETAAFDHAVVCHELRGSYLDKLAMYSLSPYEETIFLDADALILADPSSLWQDFQNMGDFSCYGTALPLDSRDGWFYPEELEEFQGKIKFGVQMHGGLYYFRKTDIGNRIFSQAKYFAEHYSEFRFAHFNKPADEPVFALAMALAGCKPCPVRNRITFYPSYEGRLQITPAGQLLMDRKPYETVVLHFAAANTRRFLYQYLLRLRDDKVGAKAEYWKLRLKCLPLDIKIPVVRGLKRFVKYKVLGKGKKR